MKVATVKQIVTVKAKIFAAILNLRYFSNVIVLARTLIVQDSSSIVVTITQ